MSNSLPPHGLQHTRPPCPSLPPEVCSNSCPLSWWRHPQSPASPLALNLSQHQGLFQWVGSSHQAAKGLELQHQSFQWIITVDFLRIDWFDLLAVQETLKGLLHHYNLKAINSYVLSLFYGPALTSIQDYWKNHSFDGLSAKWCLCFLICCLGLS